MGEKDIKPLTKLVWVTPEAEKLVMRMARVSNPKNQNSDDPRLLNYCIKNAHWSIFEMCGMCVEINTSRAVARQILRHRSFSFQEFSQRYAEVDMEPIYSNARRQDDKNRQNSIDDLPDHVKEEWDMVQWRTWVDALANYRRALKNGIAKECARVLLPEGMTPSRMYMNGSVRSWLTYLDLRCGNGTQQEHIEIARAIRDEIFCKELPTIARAMKWLD